MYYRKKRVRQEKNCQIRKSISMVPTRTRKPGKMGEHFPVRERILLRLEKSGKSQGILPKILEKSENFFSGKLKKILEKSGKFVSLKKWEP